jgi:hypothetical protein
METLCTPYAKQTKALVHQENSAPSKLEYKEDKVDLESIKDFGFSSS